jgi:O-acetyl-ADP-ribose deacetylase (regulator of RNase III)
MIVFLALHRVRNKEMQVFVVEGDILDQPVEIVVNAWNRNIIPWWLLIPQGVSGAINVGRASSRSVKLLATGRFP